jgi:hypothetical protein
MSLNQSSTSASTAKLIRNIRLYALGLGLVSFATTAYLCFISYQVDRVSGNVVACFQTSTDLIRNVQFRDHKELYEQWMMLFLLDGRGNPDAQWEDVKKDRLNIRKFDSSSTQDEFALEDQWYSEVAHPLIEVRKAADAHHVTFEDLVSRYHDLTSKSDRVFQGTSFQKTQKFIESLDRLVRSLPRRISADYLAVLFLVTVLLIVGLLLNLKKLHAVTMEALKI